MAATGIPGSAPELEAAELEDDGHDAVPGVEPDPAPGPAARVGGLGASTVFSTPGTAEWQRPEPPPSTRRRAATVVTFQAPDPFAVPALPSRAWGRRSADEAQGQVPVPAAGDEAGRDAEVDTSADEALDLPMGSSPEPDDGDALLAGSTRRRRRGRRGRGRTRGEDDVPDDVPAADVACVDAAYGTAEPGVAQPASPEVAHDADADGDGDGDAVGTDGAAAGAAEFGDDRDRGETTSRRRRRRRRRGTSGVDEVPAPDDPPNTVVHVRETRSQDDLVRGVTGSTRLEAKRQRRREGRDSGRRRVPIVTEAEFLARRESVERRMVVRNAGDRTQIAVLEDDILVEHFVTRASSASYAGNVYLGRVQNVLASMEAAFVDIGKGRNAVLYAGEVNYDASGLDGRPRKIEQALKSGQSIVVQVSKDPIGHKGARLTSQVSLPGRYLVYVPDGQNAGISRKLPDTERVRLKGILKKITPENGGVIVRTAAEGASEQELTRDIERLAAKWEDIKAKAERASAPALLYGEPDLVVRVIRDIFNEDFTELVVQGATEAATIEQYVAAVAPDLLPRVRRHVGTTDVFDAYRVDEQLAKALDRKVWLPSGGSLVIDRTEAMTVIDVNTGKFTGRGGGNLEETVTKNNLEAADEIVRQLRLRDIGGIIVIDFIDMVLESNRELVLRRLTECLGRDRTRHQVAEVTSLGLVQMTRKRVGQGLLEAYSEPCVHCNGRGLLIHLDGAAAPGQQAAATAAAPTATSSSAPASAPPAPTPRRRGRASRAAESPAMPAMPDASTAGGAHGPGGAGEVGGAGAEGTPGGAAAPGGAAGSEAAPPPASGLAGGPAEADGRVRPNGVHPATPPADAGAAGGSGAAGDTGGADVAPGAAQEASSGAPLVYANAADPDSITNEGSTNGADGYEDTPRPTGRRRASRPAARPSGELTPPVL